MNSPAENRRRIAGDASSSTPRREESWAKLIQSSADMLYAESQGRLIPNDQFKEPREVHVRKKEL